MNHDRIRVYVSGPYTSDPDRNTALAIEAGQVLLEHGYAPLVPHLTHFWHQRFENDWETWLELDLPWVAGADAVFRLHGASSGADAEVAYAEKLGIPIFRSLDEMNRARDAGQLAPTTPAPSRVPLPVAVALDRIENTFAKKNADYAEDTAWLSNFVDIAHQLGTSVPDAIEALIAVKQARLRSLRANGRTPINEGVVDTKLDRAVYAVISLAQLLEESDYGI